jgi:uncharacterized protein (TIGR03382 family)
VQGDTTSGPETTAVDGAPDASDPALIHGGGGGGSGCSAGAPGLPAVATLAGLLLGIGLARTRRPR